MSAQPGALARSSAKLQALMAATAAPALAATQPAGGTRVALASSPALAAPAPPQPPAAIIA